MAQSCWPLTSPSLLPDPQVARGGGEHLLGYCGCGCAMATSMPRLSDFDDLALYASSGPGGSRRQHRGRSLLRCAGMTCREIADWPVDRLQQLASQDDQQRMALDDLADDSLTAARNRAARRHAMADRGHAASGRRGTWPLDRFCGALTDEQKGNDSANQAPAQPNARSRGLVQSCTEARERMA
jgi:hypothetical protein